MSYFKGCKQYQIALQAAIKRTRKIAITTGSTHRFNRPHSNARCGEGKTETSYSNVLKSGKGGPKAVPSGSLAGSNNRYTSPVSSNKKPANNLDIQIDLRLLTQILTGLLLQGGFKLTAGNDVSIDDFKKANMDICSLISKHSDIKIPYRNTEEAGLGWYHISDKGASSIC